MSYCLNPNCSDRANADNLKCCQGCGCNLIINDRYRLIRPIRELGGSHQTEIFEIDDCGTPRILKVLITNRRRFVKLFEQECQILEQLSDLSVPQFYGYFTFTPIDSRQKLRCLVMEKVEGIDLKQRLKKNGKLTQALAIEWLRQLLAIVEQVHQESILHRDIKPSNIMIRPDRRLVLIDFGTARKLTRTYVKKLEESDITTVYSTGYTAPEQHEGQAVVQSDLFSLGRTFVYLMTGICPNLLPKTKNGQLKWHHEARQISAPLKEIIDGLICLNPSERPLKAEILNRLERINDDSATETRVSNSLNYQQRNALIILGVSIAITSLVLGMRYLGWLQPMELRAYDRLMLIRPMEAQDNRLLIITVDEADIQYQNQQGMSLRWSLSDEALAQLLNKIEPYEPRTIGIDIYRDFAVDPDYGDLALQFAKSDRLYAVCKVPAPEDGTPKATPPPPEIPAERIGFSDLVADNEDIIRRQLLHLTPPQTSSCRAEYAFSLQLALDYLKRLGIKSTISSQQYLQIGNTVFKPIDKHAGGYQNIDAAGYQILLNYRALGSPKDIAQNIALQDILSDRLDSQLKTLIKDRLVLIGVTASSSTDDWQTSYSQPSSATQKQIPGVFVQAQMTSQIISAVLDNRPLIWWWSSGEEVVWIWVWSLIGAAAGLYLRRPLWLGMAIAFSLLCLFLSCWLVWLNAGWIPFIPGAIAIILASLATALALKQLYRVKMFWRSLF